MRSTTDDRPRPTARRVTVRTTVGALAVSLLAFAGVPIAGSAASGTTVQVVDDTGFGQPYAGPDAYLPLAATQLTSPGQLHEPLGQARADEIAAGMGLDEADAFTSEQYLAFISGEGVGGDPAAARLVDESVRILTNTVGRPMRSVIDGQVTESVLASYGLYVNEQGVLMSPANEDAPTRQVNAVIAPGGYMGTWCRANGCEASIEALYASAYLEEAVFGLFSQQISGTDQLVPNTRGGVSSTVGMPMAPSIWLTNFALIYVLNPSIAAAMPAYWTPIPPTVVDAIRASEDGQVPYCQFASDLGASAPPCPTPPSPAPTPVPSEPAAAAVVVPSFTG